MKGNVALVGVLKVGDWARKWERMGEVEGEGMVGLRELDELSGVGISEELVDPDDPDEADMDRTLPLAGIGIEMGNEGFASLGFVCSFVDIIDRNWMY